MISNSILFGGAVVLNAIPSTGASVTQTMGSAVRGYFAPLSPLAAMSDLDYCGSPLEQIRTEINKWLGQIGSKTFIETEDSTLRVGPPVQIPQSYIDSYEPVFKLVLRHRMDKGAVGKADLPTEDQKNAALLGLANLIFAWLPAPSPMFLEDGTIGAYWRRGQEYASIDFEVDGKHSWAGTDGTKFHSGTWELPGEQVPAQLCHTLQSISFRG